MKPEENCFHCGEPNKDGDRWAVEIDGEIKPMCCPGCKAVAETIIGSGLRDYYRHRTELPELSPSEIDSSAEIEARDSLKLYDSEAMQRRFVAFSKNENNERTAEATLVIDGISCAACAWLIEHQLDALDAVEEATLNLSNHRLVIRWHPDEISVSTLIENIYRLGYKASPFSATDEEQIRERENKKAIRRLAVAGIGMMQVMMIAVPLYVGMAKQYEFFMRMASIVLTLPVVLYAARPFFEAAIRDLKTRHLTMDVPVSLAILLAFCASIWSTFNQGKEVYFDSVCMFTFFLLLGRFMEMRARHRMGKSGNNLLTLLPSIAIKIGQNSNDETLDAEAVISTSEIQIGDHLLIKPGHSIPADGKIIAGTSSVDEAALTGEYLPVKKSPGSHVIGGTINVESPLTMEVTATGAEAELSTIMRLMDRAQQEKPKIALVADRIASHFVAAVLVTACSVFFYWWWMGNEHAFFIALSVLVVTCPCALSLATPTALTAATGALREAGLLISKGHVLETLPKVTRVVFDKTGTLTHGKLTLDRLIPVADLDESTLLYLAKELEKHSSHPIAKAFQSLRAKYQAPGTLEEVVHQTAQGVSGYWKVPAAESKPASTRYLKLGKPEFCWPQETLLPPSQNEDGQWLLMADENQPLGWFLLSDSTRRSAAPLIAQLNNLGIQSSLLTGDPGPSGARLGKELYIQEVLTGLSPKQKLNQVKKWQSEGDLVLMLGDGINDVPVLAGADVSLAVNEATDLAKTNADILLTSGKLDVLAAALGHAHRTGRVIRQNIGWALLYNLIALPVAAAGFVPPWAAAIGMSFSSLLVVTNALRLNKIRNPSS